MMKSPEPAAISATPWPRGRTLHIPGTGSQKYSSSPSPSHRGRRWFSQCQLSCLSSSSVQFMSTSCQILSPRGPPVRSPVQPAPDPPPRQLRCWSARRAATKRPARRDRRPPPTADLDDELAIPEPAVSTTQPGPAHPAGGENEIGTRPRSHHQQHGAALAEPPGQHPLPGRGGPRGGRERDGDHVDPVHQDRQHLQHIGSRLRDDGNPVQVDAEFGGRQQADAGHSDQRRPGVLRTGQQREQQTGGTLAEDADHRTAGQTTARQNGGKRCGDG